MSEKKNEKNQYILVWCKHSELHYWVGILDKVNEQKQYLEHCNREYGESAHSIRLFRIIEELTHRKCLICNKKCKEIGKINRFNQVKPWCCQCYLSEFHKMENNPDFNKKDFCNLCKVRLNG